MVVVRITMSVIIIVVMVGIVVSAVTAIARCHWLQPASVFPEFLRNGIALRSIWSQALLDHRDHNFAENAN
jgi:hypothetical protein